MSCEWQPATPRTGMSMLRICRNLRSSRFYVLTESFLHGSSFEHFSPTFSFMGMDDYWKHLVRASGTRTSLLFIVIPRITSRRTTFNSHSFLVFLRAGIQLDHFMDPFPIFNLACFPWWLRHGAMGPFEGTPLRETWNERTFEFTHFNLVIRFKYWEAVGLSSIARCVELRAAVLGNHLFYHLAAIHPSVETSCFQETDSSTCKDRQ